ncbi:MAG: hypothetical protein IKO72_07925 [Kiritimatiellae bacterium]|nr:hypothetical protein [Kiritimatiellia bacterium]
MPTIHAAIVKRRRAYTSEDLPWDMDESTDQPLWRYLRGGGIRAFATTSARTKRSRRQTRFLYFSAAVFALWVVFFFV